MEISLKPRHWMLALALIITIVATTWVSTTPSISTGMVVSPTADSAHIATIASFRDEGQTDNKHSAINAPLRIGQPRTTSTPIKNIFASTSWFIPRTLKAPPISPPAPPPPLAVNVTPPPPPAPLLPFHYLGQLQDRSGHVEVFLLKGNTIYIAREGDVLDDTYRVTKIGHTQVSFLCLPLQLKQFLATGGAS